MKLLEAKVEIEQYILDNYNETEIHWSGTRFDTEGKDEWIHLEYVADIVSDCGFDNEQFVQNGNLFIEIISNTPFRCNKIGDILLDLFKGKSISTMHAGRVKIISQDYYTDIDKTVLALEIEFRTI